MFLEPGTGKTLITLSLIAEKYNRSKIDKVLIVGPKVANETWRNETYKHLNVPYAYYPVFDGAPYSIDMATKNFNEYHGTYKTKSLPYRNEWRPYGDFLNHHYPLMFVYISIHSVANRIRLINEHEFDVIVLDESHMIKKPSGKNSKAMAQLNSVYKYILTGTPIDSDSHQLWAQWRFCYPQLFGTNWVKFREEWCDSEPVKGKGGNPIPFIYHWTLKPELKEEFENTMKPYSYVATKKVLGLRDPEIIHHVFDMPLQLRSMYDTLKREMIVEFENGNIVADSIGAELIRLQQLTSGIAVNEEGESTMIDKTKIEIVRSLIELHNQPAVVFCRFKPEKNELIRQFQKDGYDVVEISGERKQNWETDWDIVVAQVQAGGMSIDLTRSHHAYFLSRTYSYIDFFQCISRIHRSGQKHWVKIWSIEAEKSIDKLLSHMIQLKQSNVKVLFDLLINNHFSL